MSIGFFAHLYVEIIQHEGTMDWLKKVFIAQKSTHSWFFCYHFHNQKSKNSKNIAHTLIYDICFSLFT